MRVGLVLVALENEENWQLPDRRQIQRLEERSLLGGAIAEEAIDNLASPLDLRRQRRSGSMSDALADDGRRPGKVIRRIRQVHGAAKSLAQPAFPAVELGHDF